MNRMTRTRRVLTAAVAAGVVAGGVAVVGAGSAAGAADPVEVRSTQVSLQCYGQKGMLFFSPPNPSATTSASVTAPPVVAVGEEFDMTLTPGSYTAGTAQALGRIKWDFALPSNAEVVSGPVLVGKGTGVSGDPVALRVNSSGVADAKGAYLRIVGEGNATTFNGVNAENYTTGLQANGAFQLPGIKVRLKATSLGKITPQLRGPNSGNATATEHTLASPINGASVASRPPARTVPRPRQAAISRASMWCSLPPAPPR